MVNSDANSCSVAFCSSRVWCALRRRISLDIAIGTRLHRGLSGAYRLMARIGIANNQVVRISLPSGWFTR